MSNVAYVATRLQQVHGWDRETSVAYAANIQQESAGNPNAYNAQEDAYGIAQWRFDRLAKLRGMYGRRPNLDQQIDFIAWEANNTERGAHGKVLAAQGVDAKTAAVDRHYERSAGLHTGQRIANARKLMGMPESPYVEMTPPSEQWTATDYAGSRMAYDNPNPFTPGEYEPMAPITYDPMGADGSVGEYISPLGEGVNYGAQVSPLNSRGMRPQMTHGQAFWMEFTNSGIWKLANNYLYSPVVDGNAAWAESQPNGNYVYRALEDGFTGDEILYMGRSSNDRNYEWRKGQTELLRRRRDHFAGYDGYADLAGALVSPDSIATMFIPMGIAWRSARILEGSLKTGARAAMYSIPAETALEVVRSRYDPIENNPANQFARVGFAVAGAAGLAMPVGAYAAARNLRQLRGALGEQYMRAAGENLRPEVKINGAVMPIKMTHRRGELGGQLSLNRRPDVEIKDGQVQVTREFAMQSRVNFEHNRAPGVETMAEQLAYDIASHLKKSELSKGGAKPSLAERIGGAAGRAAKGGGIERGIDASVTHEAGIEAVESVRESMNRLHKNAWVEHISRIQDSAYKRVHRNSLTGGLRDFMEVLVGDGGFAKASHALGHTPGPSIASRVATYDGITAKMTDMEKDLFSRYLGIPDNRTFAGIGRSDFARDGNAISQDDFRRRVSRSLVSGVEDEIPEVNQLVTALNAEYAKIKDLGDRFGVFDSKRLGETRRQHIQNNMDAVQDRIMREGDDLTDEELGELTAQLDELNTDMKMAREEPSEDYFTRIINQAAIRENRDAFTAIVAKWMKRQPYIQEWKPSKADWRDYLQEHREGMTPDQVRDIEAKIESADTRGKWIWVKTSTEDAAIQERAERAVQKMLDEGEDDAINLIREPHRPVFGRQRALDIPNSHLLKDGPNGNGVSDFIETNYAMVLQTYLERMAPAIELSRTFARPADGVDWQTGLKQAMERARFEEGEKWLAMKRMDVDAVVENLTSTQGGISPRKAFKPTPEQMAQARQALDEMGLHDVRLEPFDPNHPDVNPRWTGAYVKAAADDPGTIFVRGDILDFMGTVRHETIHALRKSGAFTEDEWSTLVEEGMKYRELFKLDSRWGQLSPEEMGEEAVAEMFRYWTKMQGHPDALSALRRAAGLEPFPPKASFIRRLFDKMVKIFSATAKATGGDVTEVDKIFGGIYGRDVIGTRTTDVFDDHWLPIERDMNEMIRRVSNRVYKNPDRWDNRTASALKSWGALTYMGMSAFPALQEMGMIAARHGFGRMLGSAFFDADEGIASVVSKAGRDEIILAGASLDIQKGASLSTFAETGIDPAHITRSERILRAAGSKYQLFNLLAPVTRRLKEMDGALRVTDTLARIDRVARGAETGDDIEFLARYGISPKAAKMMAQQPISKTEHGWIANTEAWTNEDLVVRFRSAIRQGNENTILMATHADRPTIVDGVLHFRKSVVSDKFAKKLGMEDAGGYWRMQSGMLSLPFMFWNYGLAATNKIVISGIDEPSMRLMSGLSAMVGLTWFVEAVRSNGWPHMNAEEKMAHVIEKSGIVGIAPEYMKTVSDSLLLSTGRTPFNEFDRHRVQGLLGLAGAGPTAAANLIGGTASMDPDMFRYGLAGQNHFLLRDVLDATVEGIERNGG
jgi:hypothetical protein